MGKKKAQPVEDNGQQSLFEFLMSANVVPEYRDALPLALIDPPQDLEFPEEAFVKEICDTGLINPILVQPTGNGRFKIVCGGRRWYALARRERPHDEVVRILNKAVPTAVFEQTTRAFVADIPDALADAVAIADNERRKPNLLSLVSRVKSLLAQDLTAPQITKRTGLRPQAIKVIVRLISADPRILQALRDGRTTANTAKEASKLHLKVQTALMDKWEESGEEKLTMDMVDDIRTVGAQREIAAMSSRLFAPLPDEFDGEGETDETAEATATIVTSEPKKLTAAVSAPAAVNPYTPPATEMWAMLKAMYDNGSLDGTVENTHAHSTQRGSIRRFVERHLEIEEKTPLVA